jgi:hypothetical protein
MNERVEEKGRQKAVMFVERDEIISGVRSERRKKEIKTNWDYDRIIDGQKKRRRELIN